MKDTMLQELTWIGIALVTTAYIAQRHMAKPVKLAPVPSAQREVDPTRWRHDGTQPTFYKDGNRSSNWGTFGLERELLKATA